MNHLNACISMNVRAKNPIAGEGTFDSGILKLTVDQIPAFCYGNKKASFNKKTNTVTAVIGYLSNLAHLCKKYQVDLTEDATVIEKIYQIADTKFFGEVEGSFTVFIWNGNTSKGYVFQDEYGSGVPVYYTASNSMLCIGTSLRELLIKMPVKRELNIDAIRDFMIAKTIVPNRHTFIKGIYKLVPGEYLVVNGVKQLMKSLPVQYPANKVTLEYAKSHLIEALKESIHNLSGLLKSKQRICTLSAGYDSNAVIHFLSELSDSIQAFTIGGQRRNEIPNASRLAEHYPQVKHHTAVVGSDKLAFFPDIVWRTEGYVCESGLFLQYELASLLNKQGFTELMCGEAGDQILNQLRKRATFTMLRNDFKTYINFLVFGKIWPEKFRESNLFKYLRRPSIRIKYDIELDYILKKSGLLMNSFEIQPICPFVNRKMAEISIELGSLNLNKNFYKQELGPLLGQSKMALITKAGGATDVEYLFEGYDKIILKLLDDDFFRLVMHPKRIALIKKDMIRHSELIIRLLYIYLFNLLFISGKFDAHLADQSFQLDLSSLINN